jgi:peptidoglycan/xylan/chitin deacetylase (PgdA/CDA1 family)
MAVRAAASLQGAADEQRTKSPAAFLPDGTADVAAKAPLPGRFARQAAGGKPDQPLAAAAGFTGPTALSADFTARPGKLDTAGMVLAAGPASAPGFNIQYLATSQADVHFVNPPNGGAPLDLVLPSGPPHMPQATLRPGLTEITRGNPRQKMVALTFDDGPHPEYTAQLLALLDYYHIHATFFVVGVQAQKYPQWVKMIHQAGHEIGNHTFDHFRMPALPVEEQAYQIDENQRLLAQLTGDTPRFFRPPGGRYSDPVARLLHQRGMLLALWDVPLNDTAEDREAGDLYSTASHRIRPGSVVLGHDGIQATIDMLPQLIESLQKEGYSFVTMSELASGM